ncbi:hypothetical protein [Frondihabitans australicus]|uniref:Uncharacterized protein n=1 Tax=Frondihabitans australicus TaxID=386892 RepID=A0A495IK26_9MICO|nr:hypothetical protein [Frondihabitans australicus]RKR76362.1 hypothetical protein C8E83_3532 [Frondihabitans australicus]
MTAELVPELPDLHVRDQDRDDLFRAIEYTVGMAVGVPSLDDAEQKVELIRELEKVFSEHFRGPHGEVRYADAYRYLAVANGLFTRASIRTARAKPGLSEADIMMAAGLDLGMRFQSF